MLFEWDENKNSSSLEKHGIDFDLAVQVFDDPNLLVLEDTRKDYGEVRTINIGLVENELLLTTVSTDRQNKIRIISARKANKKERQRYNN